MIQTRRPASSMQPASKGLPCVGFIGAGRTGAALAWHCNRLGYRISGISDRVPKQAWVVYGLLKRPYERLRPSDVAAASDVLFITTPDDSIGRALAGVRRWLAPRTIVAHCSGTLGSEVLRGAAERDLDVLALHPVQTFPSHAQAINRLPGSFFAIEGSRRGVAFGKRLARALHGKSIVVRGADRPLYHAMCVFSSNLLLAVLDGAELLAAELGISRTRAARVLSPLTQGAVDASRELGAAAALTGPVARGDATTVRTHVAVLTERAPELIPVYRALTLRLIDMARRDGLSARAARRLRSALESGQ